MLLEEWKRGQEQMSHRSLTTMLLPSLVLMLVLFNLQRWLRGGKNELGVQYQISVMNALCRVGAAAVVLTLFVFWRS